MSRFTDHIPENVLNSPGAAGMAAVLDGAQTWKEDLIRKGNRFYNPILLTNLAFERKLIEEYGWPEVPADFPKEILDNMWLNAENVMALRGSKRGFEYWLRVLTCGLPAINDSSYYPLYDYIILGDLLNGYLFSEDMFPNKILYLFGDQLPVTTQVLTATIATPYFTLQSLKDYIRNNVKEFIGFSDGDVSITINFVDGPRVPNPYANPYFVNLF